MHMGYVAVRNIHQLMNQKLFGTEPSFLTIRQIPPMIGLAIGAKGVAHGEFDGTTFGSEVMKMYFGEDLGFTSKSPEDTTRRYQFTLFLLS